MHEKSSIVQFLNSGIGALVQPIIDSLLRVLDALIFLYVSVVGTSLITGSLEPELRLIRALEAVVRSPSQGVVRVLWPDASNWLVATDLAGFVAFAALFGV